MGAEFFATASNSYIKTNNEDFFYLSEDWSLLEGTRGSFIDWSCKYDTLPESAFYSDVTIVNVTFPVCTSIGHNTFNGCKSLISISFPVCSSIDGFCFAYCSNLSNIYMPNCIYINSQAFFNCTSLSNISLPNCEVIGFNAFSACTLLSEFVFNSKVSQISNSAFFGCGSLKTLTFMQPLGFTVSFGTSVFYSKTARSATIYHYGNANVLNYNYSADNVTPTFVDLRSV